MTGEECLKTFHPEAKKGDMIMQDRGNHGTVH